MAIKQSVINTFNRVGINYQELLAMGDVKHTAANWFSGERVQTTPLVAKCIDWVYKTQQAYDGGDFTIKVQDFDRIRYFILAEDSNAYRTCID